MTTLTNEAVLQLLTRGDVQREFPDLQRLAARLHSIRRSSCCRGAADQSRDKLALTVKSYLRHWQPEQQARLKQMLRAERIGFYVEKTLVTF